MLRGLVQVYCQHVGQCFLCEEDTVSVAMLHGEELPQTSHGCLASRNGEGAASSLMNQCLHAVWMIMK